MCVLRSDSWFSMQFSMHKIRLTCCQSPWKVMPFFMEDALRSKSEVNLTRVSWVDQKSNSNPCSWLLLPRLKVHVTCHTDMHACVSCIWEMPYMIVESFSIRFQWWRSKELIVSSVRAQNSCSPPRLTTRIFSSRFLSIETLKHHCRNNIKRDNSFILCIVFVLELFFFVLGVFSFFRLFIVSLLNSQKSLKSLSIVSQ